MFAEERNGEANYEDGLERSDQRDLEEIGVIDGGEARHHAGHEHGAGARDNQSPSDPRDVGRPEGDDMSTVSPRPPQDPEGG
jgi:hypothetical protein